MLNLKNTLDGYLKNVEVIGNTVQDTNDLANIRSVGDKVEGQELYKIDIVSCGKNLFDGVYKDNNFLQVTGGGIGDLGSASGHKATPNYVKLKPNSTYRFSTSNSQGVGIILFFYDKNKKYIRHVDTHIMPYTKLTTNENEYYIRWYGTDANISAFTNAQLEEGTVATEYEPYQEEKLEILSPVQLEKVGDVADRIICKDGVWGVEKNIGAVVLGGSDAWYQANNKPTNTIPEYRLDRGITNYYLKNQHNSCKVNAISNKYNLLGSQEHMWSSNVEGFGVGAYNFYGTIYVSSTYTTLTEFKENLGDLIIKYQLAEPQFISLPHDQQVKLRTFAGQTNIAFLTEIPGQIKAQVPKSLGATVNTHTEQIADLHNSLDRVKKLEETTVSTIETESNFTTVDATSNGYFEDVKLEGKTLVNLYGGKCEYINKNLTYTLNQSVKSNTVYTMICKAEESCYYGFFIPGVGWEGNGTNQFSTGYVIKTITSINGATASHFRIHGATDSTKVSNFMLLEGDHTNNPPEFFEGLMSVGQDVEEVSVGSVDGDGNLLCFDKDYSYTANGITFTIDSKTQIITVNGTCTTDNTTFTLLEVLTRKRKYDGRYSCTVEPLVETIPKMSVRFYNKDYTRGIVFNLQDKLSSSVNYISDQVTFSMRVDAGTTINNAKFKVAFYKGDIKPYTNYQGNKKPLLYFNPTTEMWEKPVLREWDTIEKHSDGKYYYHKRSGEVVFNDKSTDVNCWSNNPGDVVGFYWYSHQVVNDVPKTNGLVINNLLPNNVGGHYTTVEGFRYTSYFAGSIHKDKLGVTNVNDYTTCKSKILEYLGKNNITVVYQLAQEEVYECTNIDLMTYSGETNYIINSGAISPKSLLKVHNNISNVVKILQEKVSLLENTFIAGLKSVLSGDMYSLATILYPEDFEQNDNTEQDIMVIPE